MRFVSLRLAPRRVVALCSAVLPFLILRLFVLRRFFLPGPRFSPGENIDQIVAQMPAASTDVAHLSRLGFDHNLFGVIVRVNSHLDTGTAFQNTVPKIPVGFLLASSVKLRLFMREKGPEYSLNGRPAKKLVLSGKKSKKSKKMKITSLLAAYNDIIGFSKISADIVFCDEAATAALTGRFIYDMLEGALVTLNVRRPNVNVKILCGAERAVSDIRISTRPSVKLLAEVLIRSIRRTRHAI